jgi:hypothetical protein
MIGRRCLAIVALLIATAWSVLPARAAHCPFCTEERGPTLVGDFDQATLVVLGTFGTAKLDNKGGLEGGTTEFIIAKPLKQHEVIKGKNRIALPKYLPSAKDKQFVIFCDVYKGVIDPYRGVEVQPGSDLVKYLTSALELKDEPIAKRLRHCFDFLNSTDLEVAMDAYREYAKADYTDYRDMAKTLPADTIAGWLEDPKTPAYRYGLYASLLGLCGQKKHGDLLRAMIDDPQKRMGSGIDGLLAGYLMLQPKEGWPHLRTMLGDDKQDFYMRYAALRTLRFFWEQRPDVLSKAAVIQGMCIVLDQPDMADFAIEDLRKWNRWELADRVLDLFGKESHNSAVVKRAILRYALHCGKSKSPPARIQQFIDEQRRRDPEWVSDAVELLNLEIEAPPPEPKKS